MFGWLKAIRRLHRAAPAMTIVPGHDYEALTYDTASRGLVFEFPKAS